MTKNLSPRLALLASVALPLITANAQSPQELPDHVVMVIEENHTLDEIIGNADAPYFNQLAAEGALFTNSHAIEHPSQPNYLDIFSGENQLVTADVTSPLAPFTTPNLAAELLAVGRTFAVYSETLPYSLPSNRNAAVPAGTAGATAYGYLGDSYSPDPTLNEYERKHNPVSNWQVETVPKGTEVSNQVSPELNQPFTAFPTDYAKLPTVSFVIPNEQHDIHDGTIPQADTFLRDNLKNYADWAKTHNSLLIVTFDEDDDEDANVSQIPDTADNLIPTIIVGQYVVPGEYNQLVTHYNILQTLQEFYGTKHAGVTGSPSGSTTANARLASVTTRRAEGEEPPTYLQMAASTYVVNQNAGTVRITVRRVGSARGAVSVQYKTKRLAEAESEQAGLRPNFKKTAGTLAWADGDVTSKSFEVKIRNKGITDNSIRTFAVSLSAPAGASLGLPRKSRVSIRENNSAVAADTASRESARLPDDDDDDNVK